MKIGDLVSTKYYGKTLIGFIIATDPHRHSVSSARNKDQSRTFYYVRFTEGGNGMWYNPNKLTIISCL